jgi:Icc-related predicted phosphoesterase
MKIAVCSDLHLEFEDIILKNEENADVLILSGDIMIAEDLYNHPEPINTQYQLGRRQEAAIRFRDFLRRCSFQFPQVVYIAGNHEFYHGKFNRSIQTLRDECAKFPNIHFLERDVWTHQDITFIGATLWTDCNGGDPLTMHSLSDLMNDYNIIRNDDDGYTKLRPTHTLLRHKETLGYIKSVVAEQVDKKFVVVGHHAPSTESIHQRYKHNVHSLMNGGYASDLSEFIMDHPQIKLWTHGHMHDPSDYIIGETRIFCNPRGYAGHDEMAEHFTLKYVEV